MLNAILLSSVLLTATPEHTLSPAEWDTAIRNARLEEAKKRPGPIQVYGPGLAFNWDNWAENHAAQQDRQIAALQADKAATRAGLLDTLSLVAILGTLAFGVLLIWNVLLTWKLLASRTGAKPQAQ